MVKVRLHTDLCFLFAFSFSFQHPLNSLHLFIFIYLFECLKLFCLLKAFVLNFPFLTNYYKLIGNVYFVFSFVECWCYIWKQGWSQNFAISVELLKIVLPLGHCRGLTWNFSSSNCTNWIGSIESNGLPSICTTCWRYHTVDEKCWQW